MRSYGVKVDSGRECWHSLRPFTVSHPGDKDTEDTWHHGESLPHERRLLSKWDSFLKRILFWARCSQPTEQIFALAEKIRAVLPDIQGGMAK